MSAAARSHSAGVLGGSARGVCAELLRHQMLTKHNSCLLTLVSSHTPYLSSITADPVSSLMS